MWSGVRVVLRIVFCAVLCCQAIWLWIVFGISAWDGGRGCFVLWCSGTVDVVLGCALGFRV